jgi:flagellar protein FliS
MRREASEKYLAQQVMSASLAKLVAMLYDRAIMLLHEAAEAIEAGDIERRWKANGKATEIIGELWQALDLEQGGEIAANLNQLYGFMIMRLTMVDVEISAQAAREVIGLLDPLRQSWHELARNNDGASITEIESTSESETATQISLSA